MHAPPFRNAQCPVPAWGPDFADGAQLRTALRHLKPNSLFPISAVVEILFQRGLCGRNGGNDKNGDLRKQNTDAEIAYDCIALSPQEQQQGGSGKDKQNPADVRAE